jgi:hypothetical protein
MMLFEALVFFFIPTLSHPRSGSIDRKLIEFLQQNIGFQRAANYHGNVIQPNFGSYFGIPLLNFDDNPVPAATINYVHDRLDPFFPKLTIFMTGFPVDAAEARRKTMLRRVSEYGSAGVKYILASPDSMLLQSPVAPGTNVVHDLNDGDSIAFKLTVAENGPIPMPDGATFDLGLGVATYSGMSDGILDVQSCRADGRCTTTQSAGNALSEAGTNIVARDLEVDASRTFHIKIRKIGGTKPIGLWLFRTEKASGNQIAISRTEASQGGGEDLIPHIGLTVKRLPGLERVFESTGGAVYGIASVTPYLSGNGCNVTMISFDRAAADCAGDSVLTRLEIALHGWYALVDGVPQPVVNGQPFQQIAVAAGRHTIEFVYDPYHLRAVCAVSIGAAAIFSAFFLYLGISGRARKIKPAV